VYPNGSFVDPDGFFFDEDGFDKFGGFYDKNNRYHRPTPLKQVKT
jgi:hypothetical protein